MTAKPHAKLDQAMPTMHNAASRRIRPRVALATMLLAVALVGGCRTKKTVRLYAGTGLSRAVKELVAEFHRQTGVRVVPDYGGSGIIISRARDDPEADLFMPGDVWYVDRLNELTGVIESKTAVSWFVPVIIVRKGLSGKVRALKDLLREDLTVALGNPKACQIGRITKRIFEKNGLDRSRIKAKESLTVNELGLWVKMGDVDAAIVWDAIAANVADSVDVVEIPRDGNVFSHVVIGLMRTSKNKESARAFIRFLNSDTGRAILKSKGYRVEPP